MTEHTLIDSQGLVVVLLLVVYALWASVAWMRRTRPELDIMGPVVVGLGLRLAATAAIGASGLQTQLRGGDEQTFLRYAHILADTPWGHGFLPHDPYQLHTVLFAMQQKLLDASPDTLRITQVGIATLAVVLIACAVHDLAGPRAGRLAAWLLALEPAGIFFSGALHKEPLMMLATGLVVLGGARVWRRLDAYGAAMCALGCVIGVTTREYAGWFLVTASVLILLHSALRRLDQPARAMPIVYAVVLAGFLITPALADVTSDKSLARLQVSQDANAQGIGQGEGEGGSNLKLEQVDFSTRSSVFTNLPQRMYDVSIRPYPWQLANASQQFGAIGTLVALATLAALLGHAWRSRGRVLPLAAPLFYTFLFLLIAYSLSAGNAGTSYRYRTHLIMLALAMVAVLREQVVSARVAQTMTAQAEPNQERRLEGSRPTPAAF